MRLLSLSFSQYFSLSLNNWLNSSGEQLRIQVVTTQYLFHPRMISLNDFNWQNDKMRDVWEINIVLPACSCVHDVRSFRCTRICLFHRAFIDLTYFYFLLFQQFKLSKVFIDVYWRLNWSPHFALTHRHPVNIP